MGTTLRDLLGARVDRILCLTCPQSINTRFPSLVQELADHGLSDMLLPFPNAHSAVEHAELDRRRFANNTARSVNIKNCTMGHYHMIRFAVDAGYKGVMLVEDDMRFVRPSGMLSSYFADLPPDSNAILSYQGVSHKSFREMFPPGEWRRWGVLPSGSWFDLATAYILNRQGMECLVDYYAKCGLAGYRWPVDACDRAWPHFTTCVRVYLPRVNLVVPSGAVSVTRGVSV